MAVEYKLTGVVPSRLSVKDPAPISNGPSSVPEAIVPREYQEIGIDWLYEGKRKMLTDAPGLGKTLQAAEAAELPCLIACPTYLVEQWARFLERQYPNTVVSACRGSRRRRTAALLRQADWYIINIQMLRTYDIKKYLFTKSNPVRTVIYDESHHLRNRRAIQSKEAAKLVRNENIRVYLLSATPMWKQADDLWMQLHILQPKLFSSYNEFVQLFCEADDTPYGPKITGVRKEMRAELEELLSVVRLGRTYKDVGRALPDLITNYVTVQFDDKTLRSYRELRDFFRLQFEEMDDQEIFFSSASVMHTLRQLTMFQGKIDAIKELLEDAPGPHVVFCWYKDHAESIAKAIGNEAIVITGDVKAEDRSKLAHAAAARGAPVVATIASLSEGVDLSMCRSVVYAEENWPPGSNYQSLSRVRRDRNTLTEGDPDPVMVYYVHVQDTIDEVIHRISQEREATIKDLLKEVMA
jgi:superfamily II DNA or RNA helicase